VAVEPALALEQLPDGIYIDLPEAIYFAQDRLGSSDLIKLHKQKEGWWWQSRWNPDRDASQTQAQNYGSALHALLLEGLAAYETRFAVQPDKRDFARLLFTIGDIKEALVEDGVDISRTSSFKLPDWLDAAALHIPHRNVWPAIEADFKASIERDDGSLAPFVTAAEDRMLRIMYDAAFEDEAIRGLLGLDQAVPVLAEVSILWTDRFGVRRRARWDKPVPDFIADLKSLGNWQGRALEHSVGDLVLAQGYDIQVGDQHVSRRYARAMVAERGFGAISGGDEEKQAWLHAILSKRDRWDWVWLFYQKPDPAGRAPVIFPLYEDWQGKFHVSGHRKAYRAIQLYLSSVERFGLGDIPAADGRRARPWSRVEPVHYYPPEDERQRSVLPTISAPHYGWDDNPVPDEEEAFA
jgi:hypothetical protein